MALHLGLCRMDAVGAAKFFERFFMTFQKMRIKTPLAIGEFMLDDDNHHVIQMLARMEEAALSNAEKEMKADETWREKHHKMLQ